MTSFNAPRTFAAARTVVTFGLVFQVAGLVKLLIVARYFGAGPVLDGYYLGLVIPTFLAGLAAALMQTGFVPAYVEARSFKSDLDAERIRNDSLTRTTLLLVAAAVIIVAAQRPIMSLLWPGINPRIHATLSKSFAVLIWTTPITGFIDGVALLLNAEGRFLAAAAAPVANVVVSAAILLSCPDKTLGVLMWSLFSGLSTQAMVLIFALRHSGIPLRLRLSLEPTLATSALTIGLPVLIASVLSNMVPAFIQVMAARVGPGAVSAFGYASRLQRSVVQAVVMSVSIVLLPHFARLLSDKKHEELRNNLTRVFAATTVFYFAAVAFVATAGQTTVDLLLQRGRFTAADGTLVCAIWLALTTGLLGATWGIFLARLFQAKKLPWILALSSVVSLTANVVLSVWLMPDLGIVGIALANSLAYTIVMILFHSLASRSIRHIVDGTTLWFVMAVLVVNAAAGFGAVLWRRLMVDKADILVILGQGIIIVCCNLLVVRCRPLSLSPKSLLRI